MVKQSKTLVRVVGSNPKTPFAADLVLFEFSKIGRTFECDGYRAVTREQLDGLQPTGNDRTDPALGGWWAATSAQRKLLVTKAKQYAPFWKSIKVEVAR